MEKKIKNNPNSISTINEINIETKEEKKLYKTLNFVLLIVSLIAVLISIDVICVKKLDKGPFFAIKLKEYNDGGTKVYYGLGYKVIKYNQVKGRRDTTLGFYTMPYSIKPTKISTLDLALELENNTTKSFKKFANQFLQVNGIVHTVDNQQKVLTLRYIDPSKKYTLDVVCTMAEKKDDISQFSAGSSSTVIGTVSSYKVKDESKKNSVNTLEIKNCFAK